MKYLFWQPLIAPLALVFLQACGSTPRHATAPAKTPAQANVGAASPGSTPVFTTVGRTIAVEPGNPNHVQFGWPGVAFGVSFAGAGLNAILRDVNNTYQGALADSFFDVVVDGQTLAQPVHASIDLKTYSLVDGLPPGPHVLWLTKRTEAMIGSTELLGFELHPGGSFLPPPTPKSRRLEVIGSSVETGYGVGNSNCVGYQDVNQNQDLAWPQLLANSLNADLMNLSFSGKGLVDNINPAVDPVNVMPVMYDLTDPKLFAAKWDFSQWTADLVIMDLGGNDWTAHQGPPDPNRFTEAYVAFVNTVLEHYPSAMIYVILNATQPPEARPVLRGDFQNVVNTLNQQGHSRVKYFEFPAYTGNTFGCDGHPTSALHQIMAAQMAAEIRSRLGW